MQGFHGFGSATRQNAVHSKTYRSADVELPLRKLQKNVAHAAGTHLAIRLLALPCVRTVEFVIRTIESEDRNVLHATSKFLHGVIEFDFAGIPFEKEPQGSRENG
jgi:hypothetical protein